jgi:hypothetical protein
MTIDQIARLNGLDFINVLCIHKESPDTYGFMMPSWANKYEEDFMYNLVRKIKSCGILEVFDIQFLTNNGENIYRRPVVVLFEQDDNEFDKTLRHESLHAIDSFRMSRRKWETLQDYHNTFIWRKYCGILNV